jgi:glucose-1-phosphate thymidylyltransferase
MLCNAFGVLNSSDGIETTTQKLTIRGTTSAPCLCATKVERRSTTLAHKPGQHNCRFDESQCSVIIGITMDKAVILAAGVGRRMRRDDPSSQLTDDQARMADKGLKAMIPIGRPFLDYLLARVADAGFQQACLVIGPRHDELRHYYTDLRPRRLRIAYAVQHEPLGTAHAIAAAAEFIGDDPFLVLNSDNYYPTGVMRTMREAKECGTAGFDRHGMLVGSNIPAERLVKYAVLEQDEEGHLKHVREKPEPALLDRLPDPILISMNCWRFDPQILISCREIDKSPRGEYEIPDAVTHSIQHFGARFRVFYSREAVLDLSSREDIEAVSQRLVQVEVDL